MLELEKKSGRGHGTFACAGQAAGERERVRSHDNVTLRGSSAGFNTKIHKIYFLIVAGVGGGNQIPTVLEIDLADDFAVQVPVRGQPLRPASLPI